MALFFLSPLWMPVAFAFYAIWREDLTRKMVIAFVLAEVLSLGLSYSALRLVAFGT
jgi:hypothetical protein